MSKEPAQRYMTSVPRSVPEGRVLAHNPVQASRIDQTPGDYGFRAFTFSTDGLPSDFVPCDCGWSGLPHYRPSTRDGEPWQPKKITSSRVDDDGEKDDDGKSQRQIKFRLDCDAFSSYILALADLTTRYRPEVFAKYATADSKTLSDLSNALGKIAVKVAETKTTTEPEQEKGPGD
jgi:hypothetical protein